MGSKNATKKKKKRWYISSEQKPTKSTCCFLPGGPRWGGIARPDPARRLFRPFSPRRIEGSCTTSSSQLGAQRCGPSAEEFQFGLPGFAFLVMFLLCLIVGLEGFYSDFLLLFSCFFKFVALPNGFLGIIVFIFSRLLEGKSKSCWVYFHLFAHERPLVMDNVLLLDWHLKETWSTWSKMVNKSAFFPMYSLDGRICGIIGMLRKPPGNIDAEPSKSLSFTWLKTSTPRLTLLPAKSSNSRSEVGYFVGSQRDFSFLECFERESEPQQQMVPHCLKKVS